MSNKQIYMWGVAGGFVVYLLLVLLIWLLVRKLGQRKAAYYDERQEAVRGRAYKVAFYCLLVWNCCLGIFDLTTDFIWCDLWTGQMIGLIFSVTVFACICIENNAYFRVGDRPRFYLSLWSVLGLVNLLLCLWSLYDEGIAYFFTAGKLNYHSVNIFVTAMIFVILLATILKLKQEKRVEAE